MIENCETPIEKTHRKVEEVLEFSITKPRETFHFNPAAEVKEEWMIGLTSLEVYNSFPNTTEKITNSNFITFLMEKVVVLRMKKSEMRLKEIWIFRVLQPPFYKMK